jgi:LPS sulfotransferase NodH
VNEQELQALRQVRAWIDTLELHGQSFQDNAYFKLSAELWAVFAGVALIHGLKTQQVLDMVAEAK